MEMQTTNIEYFEMNDGEIFGIQEVNPEDGTVLDQIIMERQVAIEMARDILEMLNG